MHEKMTQALRSTSIWISLLLHILLALLFLVSWRPVPQHEDKPALYTPAYLYQPPAPTPAPMPAKASPSLLPKAASTLGIEKPISQKRSLIGSFQPQKSVVKTQNQKKSEPIHLIGNKKNVPKPLIKLLARALTGSLIYPKMAVDFRLHGVAYVQFLLHPDGHITHIRLIKSSSTSVLDQAAIDAVTAISPLTGVGEFLTEPKDILFGFIFG